MNKAKKEPEVLFSHLLTPYLHKRINQDYTFAKKII